MVGGIHRQEAVPVEVKVPKYGGKIKVATVVAQKTQQLGNVTVSKTAEGGTLIQSLDKTVNKENIPHVENPIHNSIEENPKKIAHEVKTEEPHVQTNSRKLHLPQKEELQNVLTEGMGPAFKKDLGKFELLLLGLNKWNKESGGHSRSKSEGSLENESQEVKKMDNGGIVKSKSSGNLEAEIQKPMSGISKDEATLNTTESLLKDFIDLATSAKTPLERERVKELAAGIESSWVKNVVDMGSSGSSIQTLFGKLQSLNSSAFTQKELKNAIDNLGNCVGDTPNVTNKTEIEKGNGKIYDDLLGSINRHPEEMKKLIQNRPRLRASLVMNDNQARKTPGGESKSKELVKELKDTGWRWDQSVGNDALISDSSLLHNVQKFDELTGSNYKPELKFAEVMLSSHEHLQHPALLHKLYHENINSKDINLAGADKISLNQLIDQTFKEGKEMLSEDLNQLNKKCVNKLTFAELIQAFNSGKMSV